MNYITELHSLSRRKILVYEKGLRNVQNIAQRQRDSILQRRMSKMHLGPDEKRPDSGCSSRGSFSRSRCLQDHETNKIDAAVAFRLTRFPHFQVYARDSRSSGDDPRKAFCECYSRQLSPGNRRKASPVSFNI